MIWTTYCSIGIFRPGKVAARSVDMRMCWLGLLMLTGCVPQALLPEEPRTQQVTASPFADPGRIVPPRANAPAASQETAYRVELIRGKLVGENPQAGLRPNVIALGLTDPEIFHLGLNHIYITEGLVRQCQTDGQLAGVLAFEMGRMVSEREANVSDEVRQPDRLPPISFPIGSNGNARDADPLKHIELARFEQANPRQHKKLTRPNPQQVARSLLEHAGYQRTELDAALPLLENAARFSVFEQQFKGTMKQGDWTPR